VNRPPDYIPDDGPVEAWEELLSAASRSLETMPPDLPMKVQRCIRRHVVRRRIALAAASIAAACVVAIVALKFVPEGEVRLAGPTKITQREEPRPTEPRTEPSREVTRIVEIRDAIAVPVPVDLPGISVFRIYPTIHPPTVNRGGSSCLNVIEPSPTMNRS
jgi:hypothetical protein